MIDYFNRLKLPLAFAIVGITFISAGIYFTIHKNNKEDIKFSQGQTATASATIVVHIAGEVVNPGVYRLPLGSRINDLVQNAGGFSQNADQKLIDKTINLAATLNDGAKIYIPKIDQNNTLGINIDQETTSLVSINSGSLDQLDKLPDIGPVRAQKIIDNRSYQTLEELVEKKIISQSIFEKIKDKISLW